jgi:cellulose synthase/poly-beta-1,6-N-acetylglucosamine synthase-like glycosyltransferase
MGADGFFELDAEQGILVRGIARPAPNAARAERAANGFRRAVPAQSAYRAISEGQVRWFKRACAVAGPWLLLWPASAIAVFGGVSLLVFVAILIWRMCLAVMGLNASHVAQSVDVDEAWPTYTLLIALHREAETARQLAEAICALDYPQHRLDVKLLIEAGDDETAIALAAEVWPPGAELHILPPGEPRTKPRALNYGLETAHGEFVVVYDAEDRPHPQQLKAAVRAFRDSDDRLACVQAPLVGEGGQGAGLGGWLAGQWALEYAIQFGLILPALAKHNLPIALGGTSNHFRRSSLEGVGGWDAWNVTEDADLGLRLARTGAAIGMIAPPTLEAPPAQLNVWLAQRSRWLKGFLQTWLVLMRSPRMTVREMGVAGFLSTQLTLGAAILSALAHGPWAIWCLMCAILPGATLGVFGQAVFAITYGAGAMIALAAPGQMGFRRIWHALTLPIYWPLQSAAMIRALYGLWNCPHFWAKTPHSAVSRTPPPPCLISFSPVRDLSSAPD